MHPVLLGLVAGFGVAMPLGAIAVLLLREAMLHGLRHGLAGAAGIAVVDLGYAAVAMTAGQGAAALLDGGGAWPGAVGGLAVVGLGLWQLLRGGGDRSGVGGSGGAGFLGFAGLTAVNPLTLVFFLALSTSLQLDGTAAALFVAGVGAASLLWQSGLAVVGARLGATLPPRASRVLGWAASLLVIGLGIAVVVAAVAQTS